MGGRFLAASFYAPRSVEQDVFLDALGVVGEQWGPLPRVFTHVQALSDHTCATLRFSQNAFLELRTAHEPDDAVPLAQDAGLPFARFFRAAAVRAGGGTVRPAVPRRRHGVRLGRAAPGRAQRAAGRSRTDVLRGNRLGSLVLSSRSPLDTLPA
jgi:hypothetical protein